MMKCCFRENTQKKILPQKITVNETKKEQKRGNTYPPSSKFNIKFIDDDIDFNPFTKYCLIIEDNNIIRKIIAKTMIDLGYNPIIVPYKSSNIQLEYILKQINNYCKIIETSTPPSYPLTIDQRYSPSKQLTRHHTEKIKTSVIRNVNMNTRKLLVLLDNDFVENIIRGNELIEFLLSIKHINIITMSSNILSFKDYPHIPFISKPFTKDKLKEIILLNRY